MLSSVRVRERVSGARRALGIGKSGPALRKGKAAPPGPAEQSPSAPDSSARDSSRVQAVQAAVDCKLLTPTPAVGCGPSRECGKRGGSSGDAQRNAKPYHRPPAGVMVRARAAEATCYCMGPRSTAGCGPGLGHTDVEGFAFKPHDRVHSRFAGDPISVVFEPSP